MNTPLANILVITLLDIFSNEHNVIVNFIQYLFNAYNGDVTTRLATLSVVFEKAMK